MKFNIVILSLMLFSTSINIHAADLEHENIARFGYSSFIPDKDALYELCTEAKCYLVGTYEAFKNIGSFITDNKKLVAPLFLMAGYAAIAANGQDSSIDEKTLGFDGECGGGRKELGQSIANKLIRNETMGMDDIKHLTSKNIYFYAYYHHHEHDQFRRFNYDGQDLTTCFLIANPHHYRGETETNYGKVKAFYFRDSQKYMNIKKVCYLNGEVDYCSKSLGNIEDFTKLSGGVPKGYMSVRISTKENDSKSCWVTKTKNKKN